MIIIIQARMNSNRLPGKAVKKLGNKPMIEWTIERCKKSRKVDDIVLSTSKEKTDDIFEDIANTNEIKVYRGSLNDVRRRVIDTAKSLGATNFVRICGDSPFIDPGLIDKGVEIYLNSKYDLVTNVKPRSYPKGQSVEIIRTEALEMTAKNMNRSMMEHITQGIYEGGRNYKIGTFRNEVDYSQIQLSIDTNEDYEEAKLLIKSGIKISSDWRTIVERKIKIMAEREK